MIFMNKLTGEFYELLVLSLVDMNLSYKLEDGFNTPAMAIGSFTLHNPASHAPIECSLDELGNYFELIGFV